MHHAKNLELATGLVDAAYIKQGRQSIESRQRLVTSLLAHRRMPAVGWSDADIEYFLHELAVMDSNNFTGSVGLGEREARVVCGVVRRRHFGLGHGIGRSGDIGAVQPKAAGSSLVNKLAGCLALHALKVAGLTRTAACLVLPTATGMSMTLTLLTLRDTKPDARYVVWPRIDQKSCLKAIVTSGLTPLVIENAVHGDELCTDVDAVAAAVARVGADNVLCVVSTTSCFAPRGYDRVQELAKLCASLGLGHIVNNAYGVQSSKLCHEVNEACRVGRVDAYVQSTDKNFMVPVGGAIVASADASFVDRLSKAYPGRASISPVLDLFITLLSLGETGWRRLLKARKDVYPYLCTALASLADKHGERVLHTPHNPISLAVTLDSFTDLDPTFLGSMAFSRGVSGMRVVKRGATKTIGPCSFVGYGAHSDAYPHVYFTAAASLGLTPDDVDVFVAKMDKVLSEGRRKAGARSTGPGAGAGAGSGEGDCSGGGAAGTTDAAAAHSTPPS